jgi:peptidoglycan/LPS O-acetylase OafA/YrhL
VVFYGHLHLVVTGHGSVGGDAHGLAIATHPVDGTGLPHAAVVVFFVLSGYLVGGSVIRDIGRNRFSWPQYALRRLTRLWTVLIPALVLGCILDLTTERFFSTTRFFRDGYFTSQLHGAPSLWNFVRNFFFLQTVAWFPGPRFGTNGALWSLSSEFWYYALFPLLAVGLLSVRSSRAVRIGFALLCAVLLLFVGPRISLSFPVWLLGVGAYMVPAKIPAKFQTAAIMVLALQFLLVLYVLRSRPTLPILADSILAFSFTLLLYGLLHRRAMVGQSLYSRLAHTLSLPSYTLYACHIPMTVLSAAFLASAFPGIFRHTALAMVLIFIAVSAYVRIVYHLFERNTDKIRLSLEKLLMRQRIVRLKPSVLASQ